MIARARTSGPSKSNISIRAGHSISAIKHTLMANGEYLPGLISVEDEEREESREKGAAASRDEGNGYIMIHGRIDKRRAKFFARRQLTREDYHRFSGWIFIGSNGNESWQERERLMYETQNPSHSRSPLVLLPDGDSLYYFTPSSAPLRGKLISLIH